jgi:hypothetical protein
MLQIIFTQCKNSLQSQHINHRKHMKAKQIIQRAAHAASKHKDDLSRMACHIGCLEAEVTLLCHAINQFTPVAEGVETTLNYAGCELVVFYEPEDEGDIDITGVFANGMDITDMLMDTPVMDAVMEHVTDHAYIQRKQAAYDLAEQQMEARRDADLEGGAA